MMSDPAHKAMLYFLEVLLNCADGDSGGGSSGGGSVRLSSLAAHFHSRQFGADMREAVGGPAGLRAFLARYPALFRVAGDSVRAVGPSADAAAGTPERPASSASSAAEATADLERDLGAVRFLQSRLAGKRDRWVPVRSLCGHLGQAPADVRAVLGAVGGGGGGVGPAELAGFLARHRHTFEVQGELVSLRPGCNGNGRGPADHYSQQQQQHPGRNARRPGTLALGQAGGGGGDRSLPSTPNGLQQQQQQQQVHMSAAEYKAVMFVRKVLLRKEGRLPVSRLFALLSRPGDGAEQARNLIGWTQMELEEFLAKRPLFFDLEGPEVAVRRGQRLSIVITEAAASARGDGVVGNGAGGHGEQQQPRMLSNRRGRVFHCARLWGIIDLGQHEHVFFDRSIFKHVDDLQRHFKVNEPLYFNATLAPKGSRAKWRATKVWKECDRQLVDRVTATAAAAAAAALSPDSPAASAPMSASASASRRRFTDALAEAEAEAELCEVLDGLGVPRPGADDDEADGSEPLSPVSSPEAGGSGEGQSGRLCPACRSRSRPPPGTSSVADAACQTLSTGDIMLTNIYHYH